VKVSLDNGEYVVTNEAGEFITNARAGQHNLTLSKLGWDGKTITVSLSPGQTLSLGSVAVEPTNPLAIYGIIAAVGAVLIVAALYYFGRRGKMARRPQHRSMRGMEDLQRRAAKKGRRDQDDDDEGYL
jgi:CHASE1-domain containing sensor protein